MENTRSALTGQKPTDVFTTGAQRDAREGKGRYDLVSPVAIKRLALNLERGARHYGDRNWEKGMPVCRIIDSALRHLYQYLNREKTIEGDYEVDHLSHALFNVMALCHIDQGIKDGKYPEELDDRP